MAHLLTGKETDRKLFIGMSESFSSLKLPM
ncbi:hypothetical protein FP742_04205 [Vibrio parahaemolyticus]|uniref:Uncharacterized protein n=1 Tax=Vibrio parahaemolyticus serotype O3:K6 (strain RIMD 2210633) TaxID=223926 RepID=Q87M75_VIBPA|nr:hypothetical protein A6J30_25315 [Vibrio parahaemolyticus]BAC60646.1 hypothetical protein [Vibrio parahaemolyticus RIMD 2210633]AZV70140.1 hypothetical protein D0853_03940 [Vibrio parahaemolyticus]EGQ8303191.1 hypothetical protein [Vibrio parahaemolyticus]EGQ8454771.1 hypothetical protein [Vibrio parahaemolyticus]